MIDGTYTGVVDRVVDGETAVILLEADGEVVEQLDVGVESLPRRARTEGCVLMVTIADDALSDVTYRHDETKRRRESAQERFDRLSERL